MTVVSKSVMPILCPFVVCWSEVKIVHVTSNWRGSYSVSNVFSFVNYLRLLFFFSKGKGNVRTYWLIDYKQRRQGRLPTSPRRLLSRRKHLFGNTGDDKELNPSCITRSSTLRRSLKQASEHPMTTSASPVKILIDDVEDNCKRKQSSHSITSV